MVKSIQLTKVNYRKKETIIPCPWKVDNKGYGCSGLSNAAKMHAGKSKGENICLVSVKELWTWNVCNNKLFIQKQIQWGYPLEK